jgi:uncharacterized protein YijF (DUF1287 family)
MPAHGFTRHASTTNDLRKGMRGAAFVKRARETIYDVRPVLPPRRKIFLSFFSRQGDNRRAQGVCSDMFIYAARVWLISRKELP